MNYTEEDVRNAFKAGLTKGKHRSYFDAPLDEDEFMAELIKVKKTGCCGRCDWHNDECGPENYILKK